VSDLGLQSGLPTYEQLCEASHGQRRSHFVLRPSVALTDWSVHSGNCYVSELDRQYRGLRRDVVGVKVLDEAPLTRAETLAACISTANTFYYDPDEEFAYPLFVWDSSYWDIGVLGGTDPDDSHYWDQFTRVYVNLGGTDPETTSVLCELGFYIGQEGLVQPSLGEDLLSIGSFETLTGWTTAATAPDTIALDTPLAPSGSYAVKLTAAGSTGDSLLAYKVLSSSFVVGRRYRIAGHYETGADNANGLSAQFAVYKSPDYIQSNGRDHSSTAAYPALANTGGVTRRFTFDFIAWDTELGLYLYAGKTGASSSGYVKFDNVTIRRIWRYDTYEARIARDDVPSSQQSSPGIFFSGKSVGVGGLSFRNADGAYDLALGQLTWIGHTVEHHIGGSVPGVGTVDREEWDQRFTGIIQNVTFTDEEVEFALDDARTRFHKDLPTNFLSAEDANIESQSRGKPEPLFFGGKENIRPIRIGYDATYSKYPLCLVADCADAPNGIYAIDGVWAYEGVDTATVVDTAARLTLAVVSSVTPTLPLFKPRVAMTETYPSSYQTTLTKAASASWTDNVAVSTGVLHGDGYVEFVTGSATVQLCLGLATLDKQKLDKADIDYGANLNGSGQLQARILDTLTGSTYATGTTTKIRVERVGSTVYLKYAESPYSTWTTLHTYAATTSAPLCVKVSIYSSSGVASSITVLGFGQVSADLSTGTFTVREDVEPVRVTLDNQFLNFDVGGSELTATIPTGLYTRRQLSCEIAHQMKAQTGASALHCYYSNSTNFFTISAPSGTLNLRITTGSNKDASAWGLLGFTRDANDTGALTYSSNAAVWDVTQIDSKIILRVTGRGYKDDALGTYTGTADALIQKGTDIARAIIRRWLKRPASEIDETTFTASRTTAPESLAIYLQAQESSQRIFERLESSNAANIIIGGDGKVYYIVNAYDNEEVPLTSRIEERDYLAKPVFERKIEEVFRTVIVKYNQRPDNGNWEFTTATDPTVANKYQRIETKEIETYVRFLAPATTLAGRMLVLAQRPPVRARVVTHSKLFRRRIGDIVSVTRKRALAQDGTFVNKPFRIIAIEPNAIEGRVQADLVEAEALVAGVNCISTCQELCQLSTQSECSVVSQTSCVVVCQSNCMVSCQNCGESGFCQTSCELVCQACGQTGFCQTCGQVGFCEVCGQAAGPCQTVCELGSQTCSEGCEVSCQLCGESGFCQTSCEVACQDCGQAANCQTCAQGVGCETCGEAAGPCQTCAQGVGCESCGEAGAFCEVCGQSSGPCQTTCQLTGCETACQFSCQTEVQTDIP
jgi:hypothetical protein